MAVRILLFNFSVKKTESASASSLRPGIREEPFHARIILLGEHGALLV